MRLVVIALLGSAALGPATDLPVSSSRFSSCDVRGVYKSIDVPAGSLAIGRRGDPDEIEAVLVPTTLGAGTYSVSVTRKGQDLYQVDQGGIYLRTFACYEFAFSQKAVLRYQGGNYVGAG